MTFDQFLRIVRARWILAATIFSTIVAVTVILSLIWPKSYRASASVMVDMRPDPVSATSSNLGATPTSHIATQVDIIGSKRVALRVLRLTGVDQSAEMRGRWAKETKERGSYEDWLANMLGKNLEIKPSRESNVIEIDYEGSDPSFAAAMANAFARAYIESSTQLRVDPARQYADFFEERAKLARDKLERAQLALSEAQKQTDILATDERMDVETIRLNDLSQQLVALRALRVESANRSRQARLSPDQSTEVLNNAVVSTLKNQLSAQEANLNQLSERMGDNHPQVIELKANIASLRKKIAAETGRVTSSVASNDEINSSREAAANAAYDAQRAKLMRMKEERSRLAVLEREVESAQRVYDAIQLRLSQTNLESNNSQSGVVLLSAAAEPTSPSSPKLMLNLGLSLVLGTLLSLITVLGVELFDRRVRSPFDLVDALELPVIGVIPSCTKSKYRTGLPWLKKSKAPGSFNAISTNVKRVETA